MGSKSMILCSCDVSSPFLELLPSGKPVFFHVVDVCLHYEDLHLDVAHLPPLPFQYLAGLARVLVFPDATDMSVAFVINARVSDRIRLEPTQISWDGCAHHMRSYSHLKETSQQIGSYRRPLCLSQK